MNYIVKITEDAENDIISIYNYIKYKLLSPQNAESQYKRIEEAIKSLDFMPERHRLYHKEPWKSRGLRVMNIDNFIVFYYVDNESGQVKISNVLYGKKDLDSFLK